MVNHCTPSQKARREKKYDYFLPCPAAFEPNKLSSFRPSFNRSAFLTGRGEQGHWDLEQRRKGLLNNIMRHNADICLFQITTADELWADPTGSPLYPFPIHIRPLPSHIPLKCPLHHCRPIQVLFISVQLFIFIIHEDRGYRFRWSCCSD